MTISSVYQISIYLSGFIVFINGTRRWYGP